MIEGGINPRPEWRNPEELDKVLTDSLKFTKHDTLQEANNGVWTIYSNESDEPLVVATYQRRGSIAHLFTNNPDRTATMDRETLLADVKQVATAIYQSELYKEQSTKEITNRLRDTFLGMIGGGVVGFTFGAGVIYMISRLFDVDIPIRFAAIAGIPPAVLLVAYAGDIRYERHAARQVIDGMKSHPNNYLHGPPAIHLIESYIKPVRSRHTATGIFNI